MTYTYTYVLLEVSEQTYNEIATKFRGANYDHAFNKRGEIDMHGIALVKESATVKVVNWILDFCKDCKSLLYKEPTPYITSPITVCPNCGHDVKYRDSRIQGTFSYTDAMNMIERSKGTWSYDKGTVERNEK